MASSASAAPRRVFDLSPARRAHLAAHVAHKRRSVRPQIFFVHAAGARVHMLGRVRLGAPHTVLRARAHDAALRDGEVIAAPDELDPDAGKPVPGAQFLR